MAGTTPAGRIADVGTWTRLTGRTLVFTPGETGGPWRVWVAAQCDLTFASKGPPSLPGGKYTGRGLVREQRAVPATVQVGNYGAWTH